MACACSRKSVKRTHSGGPHIHGWHTFHQASPCRPPRNFHPKWRERCSSPPVNIVLRHHGGVSRNRCRAPRARRASGPGSAAGADGSSCRAASWPATRPIPDKRSLADAGSGQRLAKTAAERRNIRPSVVSRSLPERLTAAPALRDEGSVPLLCGLGPCISPKTLLSLVSASQWRSGDLAGGHRRHKRLDSERCPRDTIKGECRRSILGRAMLGS